MNRIVRKYIRDLIEKSPLLASLYRNVRGEFFFYRSKPVAMPQGYFLLSDGKIKFDANYEPEVTEFIMQSLSLCDVFVDVGANVGYYTCMACQLGKHVVAIEPFELNCRYLLYNLQHNGWNNVEVFPLVGYPHGPGQLQYLAAVQVRL